MIKRINTKDPDTYPPVNVVVRLYYIVFYQTPFVVHRLGVMRKNFFGEPRFFAFDNDGLPNDKLYNVVAWDFTNEFEAETLTEPSEEQDSQELQVL